MEPEKAVDKIRDWGCVNVLRLLSLSLSGYFLYVFHSVVGLPPEKELTPTTATYLGLFLLFILLPLAQKLKLGKFLEYEAKVNEIKENVKVFKDEARQILAMQNAMIATVSNTLSQNINITIPGPREAKEAKEELNQTIEQPEEPSAIEAEIEAFLAAEGSDLNFALAKLRMEIERELRRILGEGTEIDPLRMRGKFLTAGALFRRFIAKHPRYEGMGGSFDYVLKVCNAAIHGQRISEGQAHEALYMGLRMLDELRKVQ